MILFVNKRTHRLEKPYKTEINIENQPLGDAEQTKELFRILDKKFESLPNEVRSIFIYLLFDNKYFQGYFKFKSYTKTDIDIYTYLEDKVYCTKERFEAIQKQYPVELAFIISYLSFDSDAAISSVILIRYPKVVELLKELTFSKDNLDLTELAINEFKFNKEKFTFKDFESESADEDGLLAERISQKDIIENSLEDTSVLAILPTGGGKTFTFQLPALIKAKAYKGLTVVISPLQALMKNHVDSFKEKNQNFKVVAVSGYLSTIERMNIITEIENGVVDILYLAPEALRSNSIFKAISKRIIERFVIDEAHCFSSWGHDFRHDYYFIANTIKELENQEKSEFQPKIPVSCFTATAKPEVLQDIKNYFSTNLDIELKEFIASTKRYNLEYKAIEVSDKKDKYNYLVKEIIDHGKVPTIIYIPQNARECKELSEQLSSDERLFELNLEIEPFYAKIDDQIEKGTRFGRNKGEILNDFIENKIDIVIATTAFGMGIDKSDIQLIVHYEQSDSLESYLQESGRGARDEDIKAECIVLYSKEDFNRTFTQLNKSKVDYHEIDRIVKVLKRETRDDIFISPKDLARKMNIDTEDSSIDYETMIKTALLELEQAGVITRGRNGYKIFATSVEEKNSMEQVHKILDDQREDLSKKYEYDIYMYMVEVMQNIIQKSKNDAVEVDDLAERVGVEKKKIFDVLYELQKSKLLEYNNDISVNVKKSIKTDFNKYFKIEELIFKEFKNLPEYETSINLRELNGIVDLNKGISTLKKIIQSWTHLSKLKDNIFNAYFHKDICKFEIDRNNFHSLEKKIEFRAKICRFIIDEMIQELGDKSEDELDISTNKLKVEFDGDKERVSLDGFHHSLVYLHELIKDSFELRKGRLIYYQTFKISKQENLKKSMPYGKRDHYNKSLKPYYERKIESVHIQIAFLEKLIKDGWKKTSEFVKDYFGMEYKKFKKKYEFDNNQIKLPVTQERLQEIIYDLNDEQRKVFDDNTSESIMVLAGPGSGKTKTLVHKIASLVTIENNKSEYFLMLAHSRVAVAEFKNRLYKLIGNQVYDMKIFTFHSFAISLLGKKIDNEKNQLNDVINQATILLEEGRIELPHIQMFVLDEYQDVGAITYRFIKTIYSKMAKDSKLIAVGDDDQCINNFGKDKADISFISKFQSDFEQQNEDTKSTFSNYSLLTNYRSKKNIVEFANLYSQTVLSDRLKTEPLVSSSENDGEINLVKYKNTNYIPNIIKQVIQDESETIAILLRNNDDILNVYTELIASGINAKYLAKKDGFSLGNLIELQDFFKFWKESDLENAKQKFDKNYQLSKNYWIANQVIEKFVNEYEDQIQSNQKYFITVFEEYLKEIEFEEFEYAKTDVVVATMHKSKGKEFDSVYVGVDENFMKDDYEKRLLYVAITRAKKKLNIHTQDISLLNFMDPYCDNISEYEKHEPEPNRIVFLMGLGDLHLSNRYSATGIKQTNPIAGESATIIHTNLGYIIQKNGIQIAKLSKINTNNPDNISNKIAQKIQQGYTLESKVDIDYIVNWTDTTSNDEYKQVLCKVYMSK